MGEMTMKQKINIRDVEKVMSTARTNLLLNQPFYGALALRLKLQPVDPKTCPGMATDGTHLYYNPESIVERGEELTVTGIAHEVLHCALGHLWRVGARDKEKWNRAADQVVNTQLVNSGFKIPDWYIQPDPQMANLSVEAVYSKMPDPPKKDGGKGSGSGSGNGDGQDGNNPDSGDIKDPESDGNGDGDGDGTGNGNDDNDGPGQSNGPAPQSESDWQIAVEQAARMANAAGKLPAGMERLIKMARTSKSDWRTILRQFVSQTLPCDYSWSSPNRRFVGQGIYLPGMRKENMGSLVIAVDTSGSVTPQLLAQFSGEITAINDDCKPESITVIYCDAEVNGVEEYGPGDAVKLRPIGGGGTAFKPVFDRVKDLDINPAALVYLTDMENYDGPLTPADYPVLWASPVWQTKVWPWGETIRIEE